ncbi:MAG: hypothetical protein IJ168_10165 [Eubacterium sp.]|nr:hypothetical protein [Eubacterium sp.]
MNGYLMHKDNIVARIENDIVMDENAMLPLQLFKGASIEGWLTGRAIDRHRTNSRLLKKVMRMTDTSDIATVLRAHAATVTDNYWFKADGEDIAYKDILFNDDSYADVALFGTFESVSSAEKLDPSRSKSPELTNIGSFEKCWKLHDGRWYMYKRENAREQFSEIFISRLCQHFGYAAAVYEKHDDCVITPDFTENKKYDFEPAVAFVGDNEDYTFNYQKLLTFSPEIAGDYVKLLFVDTLCYNMDRHTNNYGLLRDADTGEVVKLAPNFDNNIALISRGYTCTTVREMDILITLWQEFITENHIQFKKPPLDREMIQEIADSIDIDVKKDYVVDFVINRYNAL